MIKDLVINGKRFAKYDTEVKADTVFLNTEVLIFPENQILSEDTLVKIIEQVEGKKFTYAGYLNV